VKELYDRLPVELTSVAQAETEDLRIEGCTVAYVPIIGYLLMVPQLTKIPQNVTQLIELVCGKICSIAFASMQVFVSEEMAYYKTKRMRMLDENLGDVKMAIVDAETNVVLNLQKQLLECRHPVLEAVELAATLDSLISLYVGKLNGKENPKNTFIKN
jgi:DNA mismatch repair ATPase MutS